MYSDSERRIFRVCDGRLLDPLPLRRRLLVETRGELNQLLDQSENSDELVASIASGKLAAAAREAFALPPFEADGSGACEQDCLDELHRFLEYLAGK